MRKLFAPVLLSFFVAACDHSMNSKSNLEGHYENSDASKMSFFSGNQEAIPEFADVSEVVISLPLITSYKKYDLIQELLKSSIRTLWVSVPNNFYGGLGSPAFDALKDVIGSEFDKVRILPQQTKGSVSVWARDWAPLGARSEADELRLLDFNYYTARPADDFSPQSMGLLSGRERISIPVYNEGGNFMNNHKGDCIMASRVTDANDHVEVAGDMILNNEEISKYYQDFAGCENVTILPRMPFEGTGHIDMWAKFLDDDTIIVSELRDEVVDLYVGKHGRHKASVITIQSYLNDRADDLTELGFKVIRLPMPAPQFSFYGSVIRSYINSLTVNGRALVPVYRRNASSFDGLYLDHDLLESMEDEVERAYSSLGYETVMIEADRLIASGGAIHCVTMQLGEI